MRASSRTDLPETSSHSHLLRHLLRHPLATLAALAVLIGALPGCDSTPAPESYYPLEPGRGWKYVMSGEVEAFAGWGLQRSGWMRRTETKRLDNYVVAVETQEARTFNGLEATPFMASSDLDKNFWFTFTVRDPQGFAEIGRQKRGDNPKLVTPPVYFLRLPIREGKSWEVEEPWEIFGLEVKLSGSTRIASVDETVTVPAGTFRHCLRLETEASGTRRIPDLHGDGIGGQATFERRKVEWLAPHVGLVKATQSATLSPAALGSADQTLELVAFHD